MLQGATLVFVVGDEVRTEGDNTQSVCSAPIIAMCSYDEALVAAAYAVREATKQFDEIRRSAIDQSAEQAIEHEGELKERKIPKPFQAKLYYRDKLLNDGGAIVVVCNRGLVMIERLIREQFKRTSSDNDHAEASTEPVYRQPPVDLYRKFDILADDGMDNTEDHVGEDTD